MAQPPSQPENIINFLTQAQEAAKIIQETAQKERTKIEKNIDKKIKALNKRLKSLPVAKT